jgi:hypothetical protein
MTAIAAVRIPVRAVIVAVAALALALLAADPVRVAIEQRVDAPVVADRGLVNAQREAAERALARGYAKAVDQLLSTASVRLPVTAARATAIQQKAVVDLKAVRRAALADLANASGLRGSDASAYIAATDPTLDSAPVATTPGALLAPGFFAVVGRADVLFAQIADQATRELTTAPTTPSPSPTR